MRLTEMMMVLMVLFLWVRMINPKAMKEESIFHTKMENGIILPLQTSSIGLLTL